MSLSNLLSTFNTLISRRTYNRAAAMVPTIANEMVGVQELTLAPSEGMYAIIPNKNSVNNIIELTYSGDGTPINIFMSNSDVNEVELPDGCRILLRVSNSSMGSFYCHNEYFQIYDITGSHLFDDDYIELSGGAFINLRWQKTQARWILEGSSLDLSPDRSPASRLDGTSVKHIRTTDAAPVKNLYLNGNCAHNGIVNIYSLGETDLGFFLNLITTTEGNFLPHGTRRFIIVKSSLWFDVTLNGTYLAPNSAGYTFSPLSADQWVYVEWDMSVTAWRILSFHSSVTINPI